MQHFHRDGQDYWGGIHRELGLLIYDPRDQQRLARDKVRLYVVTERPPGHVREGRACGPGWSRAVWTPGGVRSTPW